MTQPTGVEARVCELIAQRQAEGMAKYGVTVEQACMTASQLTKHALEESADQTVYLMALKERCEELEALVLSRNQEVREMDAEIKRLKGETKQPQSWRFEVGDTGPTRGGYEYRILAVNGRYMFGDVPQPIVAEVLSPAGYWEPMVFYSDGSFVPPRNGPMDLLPPERITKGQP